MKSLKNSIVFLLCLFASLNTFAQDQLLNIFGKVAEPKHTEIAIWAYSGDKPRLVATYLTTPLDKDFFFAIPFKVDVNYQMQVSIKKMGKMRLESDFGAKFKLDPAAGQNLEVTLTPSQFDGKTAKGLSAKKQTSKFSIASISGHFTNWKMGGELSLEKVVEGRAVKIQSFNLDKDDSAFSLLVPVKEEGFYYLSTPRWRKRLYIKPNDQLVLNIDGPNGAATDWLKTTPENQMLYKWDQLIYPATIYGYNLEQRARATVDAQAFNSVYQSLQPKVTAFLQQVNTSDAKFNKLFKTAVQLDNSLLAMRSLLYLGGKKHLFWIPAKEFSNVPAQYIQILNQNRISSSDLLQFGEGNEYINMYAKFSLNGLDEQKRQQLDDASRLSIMMNAVPNETLKAFLLKSQLDEISVNNYSEFKQVFSPFKKYTTIASVKAKYEGVLQHFAADTVFIGKSAYDFTLPDVNGKMVSMEDFKGKVILIDVWATWCGPCKAQMPFLKEVEAAYKGNDHLVFVGISLDSDANKQQWLNMIKEKELEGVQLLDNVGKSFARKYKINAIPRFLLINKQGKWVEVTCPLPEDKAKMMLYIDRELKKNI